MASTRKDRIVKFARKNKYNRFLIIALLAIVIFCDHLGRAISAKKRTAIAYLTIISFMISVLAPVVIPVFVYAEEIVVDTVSLDISEHQDEENESTEESIPVIPVEVDSSIFAVDESEENTAIDGEAVIGDEGITEQDTLESEEDLIKKKDASVKEDIYGFSSIEDAMLVELRESEEYKMLNDEDWKKILEYAKEFDLDYDALIKYILHYIENLSQSETIETEKETEEVIVQFEPVVDVQTIGFVGDENLLMGGTNAGLSVNVPDMSFYDTEHYSEAVGVYTNVGDGYYPIVDGNAFISFDDEFCGTVEVVPVDNDGNIGNLTAYSVLIDRTSPSISVSQTTLDDGTVVANISISDGDNGNSGIAETDLWVDGILSEESWNTNSAESVNDIGLNIASGKNLEYHVEKDGTTVLTVVAYDNVGNSTDYTEIIKVKKQYSAMSMRAPSQVELVLDPWNINGQGTLHSKEFQIVNNSEYDVEVDLQSMLLSVERQAESSLDDLKKVEMAVVVTDTGETIRLSEGASHNVFSFVLPCKKNGNNLLSLRFVGKISEGSEALWNKGDISMDLVLRYTPAEMDAEEYKKKDKIL